MSAATCLACTATRTLHRVNRTKNKSRATTTTRATMSVTTAADFPKGWLCSHTVRISCRRVDVTANNLASFNRSVA